MFLSLIVRGSHQTPAPVIIVARLLAPPASSFSAQPPAEQNASTTDAKATPRPTAPAKSTNKTPQTTSYDGVTAPVPNELMEPKNATNSADHPLDLSPQSLTLAVRRNTPMGLAQAAREQLGIAAPSPSTVLAGQIAAGAIPDCLRGSQGGEDKSKPVAIGGLLALPFMAYSAVTGKCK